MFLAAGLAAFASGKDLGGRGMHEDGLALGFELGFRGAEIGGLAGAWQPYLRRYIAYAREFPGDPLGIFDAIGLTAETDITAAFAGRGEETEHSLWLYMKLSFDRRLSGRTTLSFLMEKEIYELILTARERNRPNMTAVVEPGAMLARELGSGGAVFAAASAPIAYLDMFCIPGAGDPPARAGATWRDSRRACEIGLDFAVGWKSAFGLGIEATLKTTVAGRSPWDGDRGITGLKAKIAYERSRLFLGIDFRAERGAGAMVSPIISVSAGRFDIYAYLALAGIGPRGAGAASRPKAGAAAGLRWTVFSFD